jgi:hypothetical protein
MKVKVGLTPMHNLSVMAYPHDKLKLASDGQMGREVRDWLNMLVFSHLKRNGSIAAACQIYLLI